MAAARAAASPSRARSAGSATSTFSAPASASASPGRHEPRRAVALADLGEAADARQHERLAERERRVEHARLVDLAVGQHDDVGAAEVRRDLAVGDEAGDEAHPSRARGRPARAAASIGIRGIPTIHSSAPSTCAERLEQHVDPLVRAQQAEAEDHRPLDARPARRAAARRRASARSGRTRRAGSPGSGRAAGRARPRAARRRARSGRRRRPCGGRGGASRRSGPGAARAGSRRARSEPAAGPDGRSAQSTGCTVSHWKCTMSARRAARR